MKTKAMQEEDSKVEWGETAELVQFTSEIEASS